MSKVRRTFVTVCIILCLLSFAAGITLYLPHAENAVPDGIAGTKQIVLNGDFETAQEKSPDVRIGEDGSVVPSVDMSGMYVINNIYAGTNHVFFTEYNASKDKYYDTGGKESTVFCLRPRTQRQFRDKGRLQQICCKYIQEFGAFTEISCFCK